MKKTQSIAILATFLLAATVPASADLGADQCGAAKTKAAAKYSKSLFSCHASALRRGEAVETVCLQRAAEKLEAAFGKAEATGSCITADDALATSAALDAALATASSALEPDPNPDALRCASTKLKTSGRYLQGRLNCFARGAKRSLGPRESCLAGTDKKIASGFAKAERRVGCTTTDDLDTLATLGSNEADALLRTLSPVCGDALAGPLQECEAGDDDACPGLCNQSCVCVFPPECGDGLAELPEECDDGNLADGDGCSSFCQLEDSSALCTGTPEATGTGINAVFISDDFMAPTFLASPPLDAGRLFVVERRGFIRILNLLDNSINETPFLDINDLTTTGGERGLFSMAFDADYENNGRFFISYTNTSGDLVLARYEVDAIDRNIADESTRKELLVVEHPGTSNHNGGQVQFGGDGYLYWSMGDSGNGGNAQDSDSMLGSLLRLDVTHDTAPFATVPPTNPNFVDGSTELEYVWSKGLRNPWRFSFDRVLGDLYIGDVGAGDREEVSFAPSSSTGSENYGWPIFEGTTCNKASCPDPPTGFTMPPYEYPHSEGCAVIGGYVYRGCAMPDLHGQYFFADLCSTFVRSFEMVGGVATNIADRTDDARSEGVSFTGIISWGEDARGELYIITSNNHVYRIEPEGGA